MMKFFQMKRFKFGLYVSIVLCFLIFSIYLLEIDVVSIFTNFSRSIDRFFSIYFPMNFENIGELLYQLWVTVIISIAGAFVGMILSFFSALAISSSTASNGLLKIIVRCLASLSRNIPEAVWAIILIPCLWYGEFLGFIVMCIISYGMLTRAFSDSIDETNKSCIEALQATGAGFWQIVIHGIIPENLPALISWSLFAAENNIRSSTVVGMLAGGGIGYLIGIYKGFMNYTSLCTAIMLVVIVVVLADQISTQIRKRIS